MTRQRALRIHVERRAEFLGERLDGDTFAKSLFRRNEKSCILLLQKPELQSPKNSKHKTSTHERVEFGCLKFAASFGATYGSARIFARSGVVICGVISSALYFPGATLRADPLWLREGSWAVRGWCEDSGRRHGLHRGFRPRMGSAAGAGTAGHGWRSFALGLQFDDFLARGFAQNAQSPRGVAAGHRRHWPTLHEGRPRSAAWGRNRRPLAFGDLLAQCFTRFRRASVSALLRNRNCAKPQGEESH